METTPQQLPQPWFSKEPAALFLAVGTGEVYLTQIVRADGLVRIFVEWSECDPFDEVEAERLAEITARLADEDAWWSDGFSGPCTYSVEVGEGDRIEFHRLINLAVVGALASRDDGSDPVPDCPCMHVLHPSHAGCSPVMLYGFLPPHMERLAHR